MSGLIYYIRGARNKPKLEELKACGLENCNIETVRGTDVFQDGSEGTIFTIKGKNSEGTDIGFFNAKQDWTNVFDKEGKPTNLFIGVDREDLPKPTDFLKDDYIDGHKIKLGDDQEWIIPLARKFQSGCVLPKTHMMIREGELVEVPIKKYVKLGAIADKLQGLLPALFGQEVKGDLSFIGTDLKIFNVCVEILQTNYNLDFREISILQLLNSNNRIKILTSVVDAQTIELWMQEELEKKKD